MNPNNLGMLKQKISGPPMVSAMGPKELISEHFYLGKFLEQLSKASNIPTLPDT